MKYLKKLLNVALLGLCGMSTLSCSKGMTKEELAIESKRCEERTMFDEVYFSIRGFKFEDINPVIVRRFKSGRMVEEFTVIPYTFSSNALYHSVEAKRPFYIGDTYKIIIKNEPLFEVKGVRSRAFIPPVWKKTVLCEMYYSINGVESMSGGEGFILEKKGYLSPAESRLKEITLKNGGVYAEPTK